MRSATITAASVIGAASAQTNNANINAAIAGCVNTCQPILAASSQCGFPVPSDPTVALNPVAWGNAGWGTNNDWGNWGGYGGNWGGWGGVGGWGGWKKRDVQGSVPANTLNAGFLSGNWGGNWNSNLQCVCNTQSFDVNQVGAQCLTCVNNALNVGYGNPWLNLLATSCGFGVSVGDPGDYYGLGWKKAKRSPQDDASPTPTPDAAALPIDQPSAAPAASAPTDGSAAGPDSDGSDPSAPSLSVKGFAGSSGTNGGWSYPGGYNGGGAVPAAVPAGGPGGSSAVVPVSGGSSGGSGGIGSGGQPVFFAGAPKTSAQSMVGVAVAGSVVLFFGRVLF